MAQMTAEAPGRANPFRTRTALLLVAGGIVAFVASLVLGAYAPDMRSGQNGGTHGLSNSAVGFSALVAMAEKTGRNPRVIRNVSDLKDESLAVLSPERGSTPIDDAADARGSRVTLYVLPKWFTQKDPNHAGWVRGISLIPHDQPEGVFAPEWKLEVHRRKGTNAPLTLRGFIEGEPIAFREPPIVQSVSAEGLEPFIVDSQGGIILGRRPDSQTFVLSDPDLINNMGFADPKQSKSALALLDALNSTEADGILFDVTLNGFGHSRSPLRLMFDPPFLSITLALFAAFLLAAWQAAVRFGEPVRERRALAFGKAALVDNSAALVRRAGREGAIGRRYVDVIRTRAAALFRLPPTLDEHETDRRLDALARRPFTPLAAHVQGGRGRAETLTAAQQLHDWIKEIEE